MDGVHSKVYVGTKGEDGWAESSGVYVRDVSMLIDEPWNAQ